MTPAFWIKRALMVLALSFIIIAGVQYLKTHDLNYALTRGAAWSAITTLIYLVVLWRKLRQNPACATRDEGKR